MNDDLERTLTSISTMAREASVLTHRYINATEAVLRLCVPQPSDSRDVLEFKRAILNAVNEEMDR